ncbi:sterol desaturase family protein [Flavobacterium sp. '19STA2R22 D10 B1']|uniref:sterol desaturase family protein n=1 Tax=Flavobacterium aerium TaxID=3037261 RepID=UPI00278C04CA|nr:sterol desaturase family protein [Flavobacterium sp. '19STA2R22 D10 B1']
MNTAHYIAFAMPAFFLFLYLEFLWATRKKKTSVFKYESSISNITIGIAERLLNLFIAASFYELYCWIYDNYALFTIPNTWIIWVFSLLVTDFVWYWYHRLGHEVNFFWAAHIVHHQSEEFNLTVSARITTFQALIRNVFWCVLPFLGFNPTMVITILVVHGAYSFFTHTQLVKRIGWLEYVLITPSLHGIHHASDEKYLDKNYGDVFVFWDKMFGTFQKEEEAPHYGLTHPLKSHSFLWQHFHYYLEIIEACRQTKGFENKLKIIFGSPAVLDQEIRPILEKRFLQDKSKLPQGLHFKNYLNIQIAVSIIILTLFTLYFVHFTMVEKACIVAVLMLTLINCGALLEQRKWIYYLEYSRLLLIIAYGLYFYNALEFIFIPVIVIIILEDTFSLSKRYIQYIYTTIPANNS